MTELLKLVIDPYSRQARLYPALLALSPPIAIIGALWPDVLAPVTVQRIAGFAIAFGVLYALASFARSRGKGTEKRLLKIWGGWPTTIWLRHRSAFVQAPTLARYHQYLSEHVPGFALPSKAEEQADPEKADVYYASAIEWLKEQCRGKDFPLVEKENAEYGFRRNLRGLRNTGIALCLAGIVGAITVLELRSGIGQSISGLLHPMYLWQLLSQSNVGAAVLLNMLAVVGWLSIVSDTWVREAADQYARALLANCEAAKARSIKRVKKEATAVSQP